MVILKFFLVNRKYVYVLFEAHLIHGCLLTTDVWFKAMDVQQLDFEQHEEECNEWSSVQFSPLNRLK